MWWLTKLSANSDFRLWVLLTCLFGIILAVFLEEAKLPELEGALANQAWNDLSIIAEAPRPYNSRQNDKIRDFILSTVRNISYDQTNFEIYDDKTSTVALNSTSVVNTRRTAFYFEGSNVLVRLLGTNKHSSVDQGAVLVSSHFDSVATGYGATDDGCGVAVTLALIRYFAEHRPPRDIIFNINNGEEDFLWGAEAFKVHPWAAKVGAFVNLEGAGSGGPALLFRATDHAVAKHYGASPYPRVTTLGNDFFSIGLIQSETDYVVYEKLHNNKITPRS